MTVWRLFEAKGITTFFKHRLKFGSTPTQNKTKILPTIEISLFIVANIKTTAEKYMGNF
jgi:hypothetical protein